MEGEASLHFSIRNGLPNGAMEVGAQFSCMQDHPILLQTVEGVIMVDAGGGTIDLSVYR